MVCRLCLIFHYHKQRLSEPPGTCLLTYLCEAFSGNTPRSEVAESKGICIFNVTRSWGITLQSSCSIYTPISWVWVFLFLCGFAKPRYCQIFQMVSSYLGSHFPDDLYSWAAFHTLVGHLGFLYYELSTHILYHFFLLGFVSFLSSF